MQITQSTLELPLSPPSTPPSLAKSIYLDIASLSSSSSSPDDDNYSISTGSSSSTATHRNGSQSPGIGVLDLDSALSSTSQTLHAMMQDSSDDDDLSATTSQGVMTPLTCRGTTAEHYQPRIVTEQSTLNAMGISRTPVLNQDEDFGRRGTSPLLPSHYFTHVKHSLTLKKDTSPPTTPKGHPIGLSRPLFGPATTANVCSVTNPYPDTKRSYTTTLSYLLRIPRRSRTAVLFGFCLLTFAFAHFTRTTSHASHVGALMQQRSYLAHGRKYIEVESLLNLDSRGNDAGKQIVLPEVLTPAHANAPLPHVEAPLRFENEQEELTALIAFVASTNFNSLPRLDPMQTLEPSAVLDFDPARPNAREDLKLLQAEVNSLFPIVVMGKMRDHWHREIKKMLAEYKIIPSPLIIDLDQRRDHMIFIPLVSRLLNTTELPQLLLKGKPLGSYHDVLDMRDKGTFPKILEASGAVSVRYATKKDVKEVRRIAEAQRIENERILGPKPIVDGA